MVETGNRPPDDYSVSFLKAAEVGLISMEVAERLKGSAGMRNVLVHGYMDIDDRIIYDSIKMVLKGFGEYIREVEEFIERQEK